MATTTGAPTLYELKAVNGDRELLIAYCFRTGRSGLYNALRDHADAIEAVLGTLEFTWSKKAADGLTFDGGWRVYFSGRTQRDAVNSNRERPWIEDAAKAGAL